MSAWSPEELSKYRWYEADEEVLKAIDAVEEMNRKNAADLKALADRYGATSLCFRGDNVAGLALQNASDDWRQVHKDRGVKFYLPYRRKKAMRDAFKEITRTKRVTMNAFSDMFGGTHFIQNGRNGMSFSIRGPVFHRIGQRTFFGLPHGVDKACFTKVPEMELPLSVVIAAAEKEAAE
ncbi:hypothetical protein JF540_22735 [Salipiger thiooxidans]|uniref:hypothetical protein n=1 Tax=Salipiger thiooxidans TaxID=282683 RepID=UPI001A9073D8|nr:hypothetical protein [Salipiger thiooxidans]MBN8189506.1 hypothetical protein [Salipiger thiooxidans]